MPAYDTSFNPPAPVVDVTIIHPVRRSAFSILRGKLDTGADITVIPQRLVEQLELRPKRRVWTRGYDGTYVHRPVYYVRLKLESIELKSVRCIASDRSDVLLGRNVLNRFFIILDPKRLTFELRQSLSTV